MRKRIISFMLRAVLALLVLIFATDFWVSHSVRKQLYDSVQEIEHKKVGLLLGTSKYVSRGHVNLYYKYRIEAAIKLFRAGKIDYILVSGDNSTMQYDEPNTMKRDLIDAGIPADRIFLDYAGFRTLDSILRCYKVFGQDDFIVISQPFHNERALYIANRKDINAIAFNAERVPGSYSIRVRVREKLARVKMMFDLLVNKQPKFYGPRVNIQ